MLSDVQRLSKGMIIYSALVADFEKLDFKNDALAGVRANYFNSHHYPQSEKTDVEVDNRTLNLSYTMREGEALLWKVTSNNSPYQTVKRISDEVYCVLTYGGNGVVYKRRRTLDYTTAMDYINNGKLPEVPAAIFDD